MAGTVGIILINYNLPEETDRLFERIEAVVRHPKRVLVLDNASDKAPPAACTNARNWVNTRTGGANITAAHILCSKYPDVEYLFFMHNDMRLESDDCPISPLVQAMEADPEIAAVHPVIRSGVRLGDEFLQRRQPHGLRPCPQNDRGRLIMDDVCPVLFSARAFWEVGGFDPRLTRMYGAGLDTYNRLHERGYRVAICDDVEVFHQGQYTYSRDAADESYASVDHHAMREMDAVFTEKYGACWRETFGREGVTEPALTPQTGAPPPDGARPRLSTNSAAARPRLHLLMPPQTMAGLDRATITYQHAQFAHLPKYADVSWQDGAPKAPADATVCFDERTLLCNAESIQASLSPDSLFVLVTHDYWCHPLRVAEFLRRRKRSLLVLRHESARRLFRQIAPDIPTVVQRPGVEVSVFQPTQGPKRYDIILGGSETPDYPVRQKLNRIVRENAAGRGWNVLDLAAQGTMSDPNMTQAGYAPLLASAKVSPTGTNRGGGPGARMVTQYLDLSAARAATDDEFYGFAHPEVVTQAFDTAGVTPRYLESMASRTLLVGDLPDGEAEHWYADKMVVVTPDMADDTIVAILDYVIRDDSARETLCDHAYRSVLQTETSDHRAGDLAAIIARHL